MKHYPLLAIFICGVGVSCTTGAQGATPTTRPAASRAPAAKGTYVTRYVNRPAAYFATPAGREIVDHIISWQTPVGGWSKAYDVRKPHVAGTPFGPEWGGMATIDNGATHSELLILAEAESVDPRPQTLAAFNRGLDCALAYQYANGGWPQRFPPAGAGYREAYGAHITFNDNAMTDLMKVLRDIGAGQPTYAFVDASRRGKAQAAYEKGIDCILKCQIVVNGKLTGWCAQHDEKTFAPAAARTYELPSLSGFEGAEITELLMEIPNPDARVKKSVNAAAAWFASAKLTGIRLETVRDPATGVADRRVVKDPAAPPLWARFYDLKTGKPFFCSRDGVPRAKLSDISHERRNGYSWYGNWGGKVLSDYAAWKRRVGE